MRKIGFHLFLFVLTGFVGFVATYVMNGFDPGRERSCQVKQIGADGHAVWMPCSEWKKRSQLW